SCKGSHIQESQVERLGFFSFEHKLTLFSIAASSTSNPDHPHKVKASPFLSRQYQSLNSFKPSRYKLNHL
ncbi:hypothetical protein AB4538_12345, partial [Vibrio lentus]